MVRRSRKDLALETAELHGAFLRALGKAVTGHTDLVTKPFDVDLASPLPPVRVYMYSLVHGGRSKPREFKVVTRVPHQVEGEWAEFEHVPGRLTLLAGYRPDFDVFVLWDASLRGPFIYAANQQVRDTTVMRASGTGWATQRRRLDGGVPEHVIACRPDQLAEALDERLTWTGAVPPE